MLRLVLIILVLGFARVGVCQEEDTYVQGDGATAGTGSQSFNGSGFDWKRLTIGGGLGLTFGNITFIEVAPNLGYYLTDNILAGVGVNYTYYNNKVANFTSTIYGGRVFGEYLFGNLPFLAHAEAELINVPWHNSERKDIINLYLGGGLKQSVGGSSYIYILVLWNLNETRESFILQPNPVIRGGIAIGF